MHLKIKGYKGFADQLLLRPCVLQNKSHQGCTQGLKCYKGPADRALLQAYTCVLQTNKTQDFTQGSTVAKVWPTTCCCGHTNVCCRINQCRVAPRVRVNQGLAGRPSSAGSIQMCLAEQMNSGLHPRVNCYTGLADQLLP